MVAAFDTNIIVDIFREKGESPKNILGFTDICLPLVVCGELLYGAAISAKPLEMNRQVMDFIQINNVLNPNFEVAAQYAKIRKYLKENGTPIPENDIWIAATAIANGLKLITRDRHFEHIAYLDVEYWS